MKNLFKLLAVALLLNSCGDFEPVIYDNQNGPALAFFNASKTNLEVVIDDVGTAEIQVGVSTLSSSDRTVTVEVVDGDVTTADPSTYSFNGSVTIPANSYFGTLTIDGIDNGVETSKETIGLKITSADGATPSSSTHIVDIFQVCPVPDDFFTGMYLIEQVSAQVDGYSLSHNSIVEVTANGASRQFQTEAYISYCAGNFFTFSVDLSCNQLIVPSQDTTCRCDDATGWWGPAITPETYDLVAGDQEILVTFSDDVKADCGPTAQTTYKFTKQ